MAGSTPLTADLLETRIRELREELADIEWMVPVFRKRARSQGGSLRVEGGANLTVALRRLQSASAGLRKVVKSPSD